MPDRSSEIAARFRRETANHQMTVLHDDGLYRHLRFATPNNSDLQRFNLVTWPNGLLIRGDGPNFVFSIYPTVDLFDWFRRSSHGSINPGYWQENVVAGQVMSWSEDKFRTWLVVEVAKHEARNPGLRQAVNDQILHSDEHSTEYEATARHALECFEHDGYRLRFPEPWQHSFDDYDWTYLWGCHAIVWGIRQYDQTKAALVGVAAQGGDV